MRAKAGQIQLVSGAVDYRVGVTRSRFFAKKLKVVDDGISIINDLFCREWRRRGSLQLSPEQEFNRIILCLY